MQLPPPVPQYKSWVPGLQVPEEQQPEQVLAAQVPPQPSDSPAHFSVQSGEQVLTQFPLLQISPELVQS